MLTKVIDLVEAVMALPTAIADEAREFAWSIARRDEATAGVMAQAGDVNHAVMIVARLFSLLRDLADLPPEDAAEMVAQAESRNDLTGIIAIRLLLLATHAPFSPAAKVARAINLVRDLAQLPLEVAASAVLLAGEVTLPGPPALAAIDWLSKRQCAVVDVEAWRASGDMPVVVDTSAYEKSCRPLRSTWSAYVACCAQGATEFVEIYLGDAGILFNCFWRCPDEPLS